MNTYAPRRRWRSERPSGSLLKSHHSRAIARLRDSDLLASIEEEA